MRASAGTVLILPKGEWNASTAYHILNLVNCNTKSYIAKKSNQNVNPSTDINEEYWQLIYIQTQIASTTQEIQQAFSEVFTKVASNNNETALSAEEIKTALSTEWSGESSADETALSAAEIDTALHTEWSGETSDDETALSASEIESALST
ncbi:MAG: hypothetical protein J6D08_09865 [Lachnospiraceae bacterium]|nr:hypothetical protein [Lachnospiraceae bacterium]